MAHGILWAVWNRKWMPSKRAGVFQPWDTDANRWRGFHHLDVVLCYKAHQFFIWSFSMFQIEFQQLSTWTRADKNTSKTWKKTGCINYEMSTVKIRNLYLYFDFFLSILFYFWWLKSEKTINFMIENVWISCYNQMNDVIVEKWKYAEK